MTTAAARWLAGGLLLLTVAALAVSAWLRGRASGDLMDAFAFAPLLLAFAAVGAIVASHRPAMRSAGCSGGRAGLRARRRDRPSPGTPSVRERPAAGRLGRLAGAFPGELAFLFVLAVLLFPDGRLPSPPLATGRLADRRREALLLAVTATSAALTQPRPGLAVPGPADTGPRRRPGLVNVAVGLSCPGRGGGRGPRPALPRGGPDVPHQIKWFAYAAVTAARGFVIIGSRQRPDRRLLVLGPFVPVAAGIAIIKYRLYDIDVVISKTIVYGSLAAFITPVYVLSWPGSARWGPASCRRVHGRIWGCRSWRPRWWRWRSSRSGSGCSSWPTGWCSASGPPRMRRSANSRAGWAGPTPPTTSCPGWPGSWPKAPGPAVRWYG